MAYSFDLIEFYKRAANNIDAIFKGAKPGDIPFYQASSFKLSINFKAAKQLGISVPPALLASASQWWGNLGFSSIAHARGPRRRTS